MLIISCIGNHFILVRDVGTVGAWQDYTPWMGPEYITGHRTFQETGNCANYRGLKGSDPGLIKKVRTNV